MPAPATGLDVFPEAPSHQRIVMSSKGVVLIVEDDVSIREALQAVIQTAGRDVAAFETAAAFLAYPPPSGPSCLALDVGLPDLNGLDLQTRLAGERAEMPIIFMTGYGDVPMAVRAMKAGAVEFLTKPFDDIAMLDAVASALNRGREMIEQRSSLRMLRERYESLSHRESQVLAMVVAGLMNKQVGWELGISEITVKAHRGRVMQKMRARSFAELVKIGNALDLTQTVGI